MLGSGWFLGTTAILVLQALTLAVQLVMAAAQFLFRNQKTGRTETDTRSRDHTTALRRSENKKELVPTSARSSIQARVAKYALAPLSVSAAIIISLLIRRTFHISHPLAWFLAAVAICVWYCGLGPGIAALILSCVAIDYFILPPIGSFELNPSEGRYLIGFLLWGLVISWFSSKRRGAEEVLKQIAIQWQRRWQGTAELLERNMQLEHEVTELRERIRKLEEMVRQNGSRLG